MTQVALLIVALNLWAVLVWAVTASLSRGAPTLSTWPAYWGGAIAVIVAPWLAGVLVPQAALDSVGVGTSAGIEAPAFVAALEPVRAHGANAAAAPLRSETAAASAILGAPAFATAAVTSTPWLRTALAAATAVYAAGALWFAVLLFAAHLRLRLFARNGPRLQTDQTVYPVHLIDRSVPPCALGAPNPQILIPARLLDMIAPEELSMILRHESAHIDRRDPELTLLFAFIGALFWPNPAVRAVINRWRLAAEMRADAAVVAGRSQAHRMEYARLLVSTLRNGRGAALAAPSVALRLDRKSGAKMRLAAILHAGDPYRPMVARVLAGIAGAALAATGTVCWATVSQSTTEQHAAIAPPIIPVVVPAPTVAPSAEAAPVNHTEPTVVMQAETPASPQPLHIETPVGPQSGGDHLAVLNQEAVKCWGGPMGRPSRESTVQPEEFCRAIGVRDTVMPGDPSMRGVPVKFFSSNGILYLGDLNLALSQLQAKRNATATQIDALTTRQNPVDVQRLETLEMQRMALNLEIKEVAAWQAKRPERQAARAKEDKKPETL